MQLPAFADPIHDCGLCQSGGAFSVDRPVNRGFKEGVAIGLEQAKRPLTTQVRWSSDTGGCISNYQLLVGIICGSRNLETVLPISAANPLPTPLWHRKNAQNSAVGRLGESHSNPLYPMIIWHRSVRFSGAKTRFFRCRQGKFQGPVRVISPHRSSLARHAGV